MAFDPLAIDPLQLLQARVAPQPAMGSGVPPAPQAEVAPPPAPATGPSAGSGGFGGIFGGIGSAMSRAVSGEGVFGDTSTDAEIDPLTGAPRGMSRRANNQSIMKMGMMLMAAGMRQSDESRARLLSQMPNAITDNTEQVNNFAKNRLEMAKIKLAERELLQTETASKMVDDQLRRSGGAAPAAPVATVTPPLLATSPAATPAPTGPAPTVIPPPVVDNGTVPPAPAPPAAPTLPLTEPPPPPDRPEFQPTPAQAQMLSVLPHKQKVEKFNKLQEEFATLEYTSREYLDPRTGALKVDVYKGGQKTGTREVGKLTPEVVDTIDPVTKETIRETRVGGHVTKRENIQDPETTEARTAGNKLIAQDRERYIKEHEEKAAPAVQAYERLGALAKDVREGRAITGALATPKAWLANRLSSMGIINDDALIQKLLNNQATERELKLAAGEFAKAYYGPQISNNDREAAEKLFGAAMSNDKRLVAASLEAMQKQARTKVEDYQKKAIKHNERVGKSPNLDTELFSVPMIDYKFDEPQASAPAGGVITPDMARAELERRRRGGR